MTLLNPWPALVAAAVAVPLLLVLYFLKLRRQTLRMPSTLLWRSSTEDLQANVPFQRLRWSALLLLQLLLLMTLLAALARPVVQAGHGTTSRMILLIDRSASMNAPDGNDPAASDYSRLDAARDAARETVRRLGRRSEPAELMVVAFGATPRVMSGFESNRRMLMDAIDAIEPTDEEADFDAALRLAGAFAVRDDTPDAAPPDVVLFSDGGVGRPRTPGSRSGSGFLLAVGALRFVGVGPPPETPVDNVGIVAFSARRDYRDPGRVLIFARLVNAGPSPVETAVTRPRPDLRAAGQCRTVTGRDGRDAACRRVARRDPVAEHPRGDDTGPRRSGVYRFAGDPRLGGAFADLQPPRRPCRRQHRGAGRASADRTAYRRRVRRHRP